MAPQVPMPPTVILSDWPASTDKGIAPLMSVILPVFKCCEVVGMKSLPSIPKGVISHSTQISCLNLNSCISLSHEMSHLSA